MEEFMRFPCPFCGKSVKAKPDQAGKRVRCPGRACGQIIQVPPPVPEVIPVRRVFWPWIVAAAMLALLVVGVATWQVGRAPKRKPPPSEVVTAPPAAPLSPVADKAGDQPATTKAPDQPTVRQPEATKSETAFPPAPQAGDLPKLWHAEVVGMKHDPTSIEFLVGLLPGKAAVVGKKATLWFTIGTPTTIPSIRSSLENDLKEDKDRFFLNFAGPGFVTVPCRDARSMGDNRWRATVNFGTMNLKEETLNIRGSIFETTELPMSFVFWDDEFNLSNELKFFVNARTGKVVKSVSEPDSLPLPGKKGPRVVYAEGRDTNLDITDAYVDTSAPLKGKPAKLVTSFPAGTKGLNIMIEFGANPPGQIDVKYEIRASKGKVDTTPKGKGPVATSMYLDYSRTLCLFAVPATGAFADGPYQASVVINGKEYAQLNWSVGE